MRMKNISLSHQPVALSDLERILVKRFGGEYRGITSLAPVDFAIGCEMPYLLEQLHPPLPVLVLLEHYQPAGKPTGRLPKVIHHAVRRVKYYGDLLLLLNILVVTFSPAYAPDAKKRYIEGTLAEIREEIDLLLIEQRILEICLRQFRQIHGPDGATAAHTALLHKVSEHLQRSRSKAALYFLLELIAHQSTGQ
jgi:hypothetical protein